MLEDVLRYIDNRFDVDKNGKPVGSVEGTFTISDGAIAVSGLADGQWFWVEGSALNDGLHQFPADDLYDEEFEGRVVFLRVPRAIVEIADEIEEWCSANAAAISSPMESESFGGYSYKRAAGGTSGNLLPSTAWQVQFGARLRPYAKLSRDWV